jgi:hypothetical protein
MTFTGIFLGPNGYMGYETGKKYTFSAHKTPGGKSVKLFTAPDGNFHEFSSETKMLELWRVTGS